MEKYLVTIEFRYADIAKERDRITQRSKSLTIGVYNDLDKAIEAGNEMLVTLESKYKLHIFPDGSKAKKDRFSRNGGPYGTFNNLVTNLAYLKTPFGFYAKIIKLDHSPLEDMLVSINTKVKESRKFKRENDRE